jgi:DNA-binding MarR family transcriptional regulator
MCSSPAFYAATVRAPQERIATMAEYADSSTLNIQPRQRRMVYEVLAKQPSGTSVKELLRDGDILESDLRETLRKLDRAGLAERIKGTWRAIPLQGADPANQELA